MPKIVLIDDEDDWLDIVKTLLSSMDLDFEIEKFSSVEEAHKYLLKDKNVDLIISDYLFPNEMTGLELYYKLIDENLSNKFILISNSRIPAGKIKEIVQKRLIYLPKSYLIVKNFFKKHLVESLEIKE